MKNILIVEDDILIARFIESVLVHKEYNVVGIVKSASELLEIMKTVCIDLIFMDINIEESMDGIGLARHINMKASYPILFLSAYGDDATIEDAMGSYVVGYLVKPVAPKNIIAALNVAKNIIGSMKKVVKDDTLYLGEETFYNKEFSVVTYQGEEVSLTQKEKKILKILVQNKGSTVSIENIKNYVWTDENISLSSLRVKINSLKVKLTHVQIMSVYGQGYILSLS
ncbi:response regulator [Sulfurimonas sp. SAG-AH-194-I05]|nr:response regulator [Sulfurimonas sp. SAG-AH-194-I05]MDF1875129.1 response regulator [Sulfurimonas sp. SAG-AH-194-I05]